jgi:hypothetical protein
LSSRPIRSFLRWKDPSELQESLKVVLRESEQRLFVPIPSTHNSTLLSGYPPISHSVPSATPPLGIFDEHVFDQHAAATLTTS